MPDTAVMPQPPRPGGSGIGTLLRDPDHYEEINVIGNGEFGKKNTLKKVCPIHVMSTPMFHCL